MPEVEGQTNSNTSMKDLDFELSRAGRIERA